MGRLPLGDSGESTPCMCLATQKPKLGSVHKVSQDGAFQGPPGPLTVPHQASCTEVLTQNVSHGQETDTSAERLLARPESCLTARTKRSELPGGRCCSLPQRPGHYMGGGGGEGLTSRLDLNKGPQVKGQTTWCVSSEGTSPLRPPRRLEMACLLVIAMEPEP